MRKLTLLILSFILIAAISGLYYFSVTNKHQCVSDQYKIVESAGGRIGAITVMYLNTEQSLYRELIIDLNRKLAGRVTSVYDLTSTSYLLSQYETEVRIKFNLDENTFKNIVIGNADQPVSRNDIFNYLTNLHQSKTDTVIDNIKIYHLLLDTLAIADNNNINKTDKYTRPGKSDIWIQDCFLALQSTKKGAWKVLIDTTIPLNRTLLNYMATHPASLSGYDKEFATTNLTEIEGGNFIIGSDFIISNPDYLMVNLSKNKAYSLNQIEQETKNLLKKDTIVWSGIYGTTGMDFPDEIRGLHTDMLVTLGPIVNDTQLIYKAHIEESEFETANQVYYNYILMVSGGYYVQETVKNFINSNLDSTLANIRLKGRKTKIIDVPAIIVFPNDYRAGGIFSDPKAWHLKTYNNALTETIKDTTYFYIPTYDGSADKTADIIDYKKLNEAAVNAYKNSGSKIKVIPLGPASAYDSLSVRDGSANCVTKILFRE